MRVSPVVVLCLLMACGIRLLSGQQINQAILTTPEITLEAGRATIAALRTSKAAVAEVNVLDADDRVVLGSVWETNPGEPHGAQLEGRLPGEGKARYRVRLDIRVKDGDPGSAEALITQHDDVENLKRLVQDAVFKPDPASHPKGGDFYFTLGAVADVLVKIWHGEPSSGRLCYSNSMSKVDSGSPIHWDLQDLQKRLVPTGTYSAILSYQSTTMPEICRLVRFAVKNP